MLSKIFKIYEVNYHINISQPLSPPRGFNLDFSIEIGGSVGDADPVPLSPCQKMLHIIALIPES